MWMKWTEFVFVDKIIEKDCVYECDKEIYCICI